MIIQPACGFKVGCIGAARSRMAVVALSVLCFGVSDAGGEDVSPPPILQWFEARYETMVGRVPDAFMSGFGAVWVPPPGRADSGDQSVGYDVFDRFDLGTDARPTLYGTEQGLVKLAAGLHNAGIDLHLDLVLNHNGFKNSGTLDGQSNRFLDAGDYPSFATTLTGDADGDFHGAFESGDLRGRLGGLIDIDHAKNHRFVRNPIPDTANDIPAGTKAAFGVISDVPADSNRRFYPDQTIDPIVLFDPVTGEQGIKVFPFNLPAPMKGTPVEENALGYLMRNAQWLVQVVGADGFRLDAAKHYDGFVLDFFDRAVYRSSRRSLLNGAPRHVFSYCEAIDGNPRFVQTFVKKTINPGDLGRIGGNRDALDFPFFFQLRDNLSRNGLANSWLSVRSADLDVSDDGLHNGSAGVKFVSGHDGGNFPPYLDNVAYAYVLMMPGNAIVYHNAHDFGFDRAFPIDGRGDALGGVFGNVVNRLVEIRRTHGRGNYRERLVEKELFSFEREGAAIVLLSNRLDAGFDSRTVATSFTPGTRLIELTGNAASALIDPTDDIPEMIVVQADATVNVRFPRNTSPHGQSHNSGYLIYGLAGPQSVAGIEITNVDHIDQGAQPKPQTNGAARLTDIPVIKADSFRIGVRLKQVKLLGQFRDTDADGDNAMVRIDDGKEINGNGRVDFVTPQRLEYGCEEFREKHDPLLGGEGQGGSGEFLQSVDATKLGNGLHYIEVLAFRHRSDNGPPIHSSFRKVIRIDRN